MNQLPSTAVNSQENLDQMPIMNHLVVLRRHLFRIVGVTLFLFLFIALRNHTYQLLSEPLRLQLPASSSMIATDVTATFMAPFKLNLFVALMLAMPFILYEIWSFVRPALYQKSVI